MLTAKGEDMDKILGLEYGADDYMTKPFNILEVRARIRTVLRRAGNVTPMEEKKIIRVRDMEVNLLKRTVKLGGEEVKLTAKEFDLLHLFITNRGRPFSRQEMLEHVWKYDLNSLQYLTQLVANKHSEQYLTVMLDAEDYRSRRTQTLKQLAEKMASKALYTKKEVSD